MKMLKMLFLPALIFAITACGSKQEESHVDYSVEDDIVPDESVEGKLSIRGFERGFGVQWLENVITTFMTKYPNVEVVSSYTTEPKVIYNEAVSGVDKGYDLIITEANVMDKRDKFVDLNDVYDAMAVDEDVTVKSKIDPAFYESCSYDNTFYVIPAYCGAYGFVYNRDYIEDDEIPVTTNELLALCRRIKEVDKATPLVISGGDDSQYLNYFFSSLAAQYEGREAYLKAQYGQIYDAETGSYINDVSSAFLTGHVKASQVLESIYWQPNGYIPTLSVGYKVPEAQDQIIDTSSHTVMMFNGSWMMTEMAVSLKDYETDVNTFGMFKTPIISSIIEKCPSISDDTELSALVKAIDKGEVALTGTGYEVTQTDFNTIKDARSFVYIGSEGSRFIVPKYAKHQDLAKLFLRFYYSNYAINAFNAAKAGCYVPLTRSTVDTSKMNNFLKDAYKILSENSKFFNAPAAFQAVTPYLYPANSTYENSFGNNAASARQTTEQLLEAKISLWTDNNNQKYIDEMKRCGYM